MKHLKIIDENIVGGQDHPSGNAYFKVDDAWINNASEDELNRIIIATNDGQGDTSLYDWQGLCGIYFDNDRNDETPTNIQILDYFYQDTNGNMTCAAYFNGKHYQNLSWW